MLFFKSRPTTMQSNPAQQMPTSQPSYSPAPRGYVPPKPGQRYDAPRPARYPQTPPVQRQPLPPPQEQRDALGGFPPVEPHDPSMLDPKLRAVKEKCPWCGRAYVLHEHDTVTTKGFPAVRYSCPACHHPVVFIADRYTGEARRIYPKSENQPNS